jgi:hypothetical protein
MKYVKLVAKYFLVAVQYVLTKALAGVAYLIGKLSDAAV